ncbi:uncharacterized protein LOC130568463 [Triplophysa rosa]|uniref:uncharacterized protein LOC130568463 n=1 Tax=Triplophysa rosa TaxID=992332 RepID=UPI00254625B5|nr:uncharacterized protein LOC130568463 [Triplophysa rosa]
MATEYLDCRSCKKKLAAWSRDILNQLDPSHRDQFPAVLTYREVVRLLWGRTLGNSATALYRHLCVRHKEHWLSQSALYLSVLKTFVTQDTDPSRLVAPLPQMVPVPGPSWLLSVYTKDVLTRLPELKARVTSVCGSILKTDSTKKKLAGDAAGTAAWVTDVGNEIGQVLMCVLKEREGNGLLPMCSGLVDKLLHESFTWTGTAAPQEVKARWWQCLASGTSWWSGWICGILCAALQSGSPQIATGCMDPSWDTSRPASSSEMLAMLRG